jgi:hypothetical protein
MNPDDERMLMELMGEKHRRDLEADRQRDMVKSATTYETRTTYAPPRDDRDSELRDALRRFGLSERDLETMRHARRNGLNYETR